MRGKSGFPPEATRLIFTLPARGQSDVLLTLTRTSIHIDCLLRRFGNDWSHVASRSKRPLNSIILDVGIRELILDDARDFMKSRQWYADRGPSLIIPMLWHLNKFLRYSFPPRLPPLWGSWLWKDLNHP